MSTQQSQTKHQDISGSKLLVFQCKKCPLQFSKKEEITKHTCTDKKPCLRCGRLGHYSLSCQSKTDSKGNEIESEDEGYTSDKYYY